MPIILRAGHMGSRAVLPALVVTPPDSVPPLDPSNLRITGADTTTMDLAWDAGSDPGGSGVAGYRIENPSGTFVADTTSLTYTLTGLTQNTSYTPRVRTRDVAGNISTGVTVTGSTDADTVPPPAGTAWPPTDISKGWGLTLNAFNSTPFPPSTQTQLERATDLHDNYLTGRAIADGHSTTAPVSNADWNFSRFQISWGQLEQDQGDPFNYSASGNATNLVAWMQARGIRPIILFTFAPFWATNHPIYPNCTVRNQAFTRFGSLGAGTYAVITSQEAGRPFQFQPGGGNFLDHHVTGPGIDNSGQGSWVEKQGGLDDGTPDSIPALAVGELGLSRAATTTGAGRRLVFGGRNSNQNRSGGDDHHGLSDGTGGTALEGEGTVNGHLASALALVKIVHNFRAADPIIEYWNEANGQHGYRLGQDVVRYATSLRYIYRALKEYDPTVPLNMTGVSGPQHRGSVNGVNLDGDLFLRELWRTMKDDPQGPGGANDTWGNWVGSSTYLLNSTTAPNDPAVRGTHTLPSLRDAGLVSPYIWLDYAGYHKYGFSGSAPGKSRTDGKGQVPASPAGTDNFPSWIDPGHVNVFMYMLNTMYLEDGWNVDLTSSPSWKFSVTVDGGAAQQTATLTSSSTNAQWAAALDALSNLSGATVKVRNGATGIKVIAIANSPAFTTGDKDSKQIEITATAVSGGSVSISRHGLDQMRFIMTETGTPTHPLAVTGRGYTNGGSNRLTASPTNISCASSEEAYAFVTVMKQMHMKARPWPTHADHASVTAALGTWDPADRIAIINLQRLQEVIGVYLGADSFLYQGICITENSPPGKFPVPPAWPAGRPYYGGLKYAIASERPRPYLVDGVTRDGDSHFYANSRIGIGTSWPDAFGMQWHLRITTASLPGATRGTPYTKAMAATGGDGSTNSWSATGLGTGLSINPSSGVISGTPGGSAGTRNVTVTVTNDVDSFDRSYSLVVA